MNPQRPEPQTPLRNKFKEQYAIADKGFDNFVIHVVPHSHDDLGWTRTIDQYWNERVKGIYDSIHSTIRKDNNRTFTIDGVDFLLMWW